jgi:hypothetical protein
VQGWELTVQGLWFMVERFAKLFWVRGLGREAKGLGCRVWVQG